MNKFSMSEIISHFQERRAGTKTMRYHKFRRVLPCRIWREEYSPDNCFLEALYINHIFDIAQGALSADKPIFGF
jgi:hypothetical protein